MKHFILLAALCMIGMATHTAHASPQAAIDKFMWPVDLCGEPKLPGSGASDAEMFQHNEAWRACQTDLQGADRTALRRLITMQLDGQWQTRGDNFGWAVPADCNCKGDVNLLIREMGMRDSNRQRANMDLMNALAAAQSLDAVRQ
jgi:hypothetical protein